MLKYTQTRNNEALGQLAAADFMASSGYDRHLRALRSKLAVQRALWTAESIATYFPAGTRLNLPEGGLALWVEPSCAAVVAAGGADQALDAQILIAPGWLFSNCSALTTTCASASAGLTAQKWTWLAQAWQHRQPAGGAGGVFISDKTLLI